MINSLALFQFEPTTVAFVVKNVLALVNKERFRNVLGDEENNKGQVVNRNGKTACPFSYDPYSKFSIY